MNIGKVDPLVSLASPFYAEMMINMIIKKTSFQATGKRKKKQKQNKKDTKEREINSLYILQSYQFF